MNKDDLLKLREILKKDPDNQISTDDLSGNYIEVWSRNQGTEDDCPIISAEHILKNKKAASEVADLIVGQYAQALYVFHYYKLDNFTPSVSVFLNFIYKFDPKMIDENGNINIADNEKTFGDVVGISSGTYLSYSSETETITMRELGGTKSVELDDLYCELSQPYYVDGVYVSFDELITELSSRGFYCNYDNFQNVKKKECAILDISMEPFVKKDKKAK